MSNLSNFGLASLYNPSKTMFRSSILTKLTRNFLAVNSANFTNAVSKLHKFISGIAVAPQWPVTSTGTACALLMLTILRLKAF